MHQTIYCVLWTACSQERYARKKDVTPLKLSSLFLLSRGTWHLSLLVITNGTAQNSHWQASPRTALQLRVHVLMRVSMRVRMTKAMQLFAGIIVLLLCVSVQRSFYPAPKPYTAIPVPPRIVHKRSANYRGHRVTNLHTLSIHFTPPPTMLATPFIPCHEAKILFVQ